MKLSQEGMFKAALATKAGMDEKTVRKYLRLGKLPSQLKKKRDWRTREDPFQEVWGGSRGKA
jgi:predicted site-specific integrase-resolvase